MVAEVKQESKEKVVVKAKQASVQKANATSASNKYVDHESAIRQTLLMQFKFGKTKPLNIESLSKKCGVHERTKSFRDAVKTTIAKGHIEKVDSGYVLTEEGAAAEGFVKQDFSQHGTNKELHDHIKASLTPKWKSSKIFDLLLERGTLSRKELAAILGINDRSHSFSYGLKELKDSGFVGKSSDGKKLILTDEAFVNKVAADGKKLTLTDEAFVNKIEEA